ncbi:MAG: NINE protein [Bacillota bacterium]|nr:NINE protein [Bacillota bacterium]
MNNNDLSYMVGKEHEAEVRALIDNDAALLEKVHLRNPKVTLILSILLGILGIDRLYQSGVKLFLCKLSILLLTFGVWWFVDIGYSVKFTQERNYEEIKKIASAT